MTPLAQVVSADGNHLPLGCDGGSCEFDNALVLGLTACGSEACDLVTNSFRKGDQAWFRTKVLSAQQVSLEFSQLVERHKTDTEGAVVLEEVQ